MKKLLIATLFAAPLLNYSQDTEFGLVYENSLYNNSAFTGTSENSRFGITHGSRWHYLTSHYHNTFMYVDQHLGKFGGIGFSYSQDIYGDQSLSRDFSLKYSYSFNIKEEGVLSLGASGSLQRINIIHPSSVRPGNYIVATTPATLSSNSTFDLDLGVLYYNKDWFVSYSTHHLTKPDILIYGVHRELPIRHIGMAGYQVKIGNNWRVTPIAQFQYQNGYTSLTLETRANYKWLTFGMGTISRSNYKAIAGVNFRKFRVAYCYQKNVSGISRTRNGMHELSIQYLPQLTKTKNQRAFRLMQ